METIFSMPAVKNQTPGYTVEAGLDKDRYGDTFTLTLQSTMPGAANPAPHRLTQLSLPKESIDSLIRVLGGVPQ